MAPQVQQLLKQAHAHMPSPAPTFSDQCLFFTSVNSTYYILPRLRSYPCLPLLGSPFLIHHQFLWILPPKRLSNLFIFVHLYQTTPFQNTIIFHLDFSRSLLICLPLSTLTLFKSAVQIAYRVISLIRQI